MGKRITLRGFINFEGFGPLFPEFSAEMPGWLKEGKTHYRKDIVEGLEQAPATCIGLLQGNNLGKCVVHFGAS